MNVLYKSVSSIFSLPVKSVTTLDLDIPPARRHTAEF